MKQNLTYEHLVVGDLVCALTLDGAADMVHDLDDEADRVFDPHYPRTADQADLPPDRIVAVSLDAESHRIVFEARDYAGPGRRWRLRGRHSVGYRVSTEERVRAHFEGFVAEWRVAP